MKTAIAVAVASLCCIAAHGDGITPPKFHVAIEMLTRGGNGGNGRWCVLFSDGRWFYKTNDRPSVWMVSQLDAKEVEALWRALDVEALARAPASVDTVHEGAGVFDVPTLVMRFDDSRLHRVVSVYPSTAAYRGDKFVDPAPDAIRHAVAGLDSFRPPSAQLWRPPHFIASVRASTKLPAHWPRVLRDGNLCLDGAELDSALALAREGGVYIEQPLPDEDDRFRQQTICRDDTQAILGAEAAFASGPRFAYLTAAGHPAYESVALALYRNGALVGNANGWMQARVDAKALDVVSRLPDVTDRATQMCGTYFPGAKFHARMWGSDGVAHDIWLSPDPPPASCPHIDDEHALALARVLLQVSDALTAQLGSPTAKVSPPPRLP